MSLKAILVEVDKIEGEAQATGNAVLQNAVASIRAKVATIAGDVATDATKVAGAAQTVADDQTSASATTQTSTNQP